MKILSWNVLMFLKKQAGDVITRTEIICQKIRQINPDVVLLQEASEYFLTELEDMCGFIRRVSVQAHAGLCAILTKPDIDGNVRIWPKYAVGIQIGSLEVVNCHLAPCKENRAIRQQQIQEISGSDVLIMGDTNMRSDESVELRDIAIETGHTGPTWFHSYFEGTLTGIKERFDRAYTNTGIDIEEFRVLKECSGMSDHLPIYLLI